MTHTHQLLNTSIACFRMIFLILQVHASEQKYIRMDLSMYIFHAIIFYLVNL